MKTLLVFSVCLLLCFAGFGQNEKFKPTFPVGDTLNVYGEWQTIKYMNKGEEMEMSCRFKVRKKFMLTCLYTIEIRNDSKQNISCLFVAGNKGTNYYEGQIGVVREKVKLSPGATKEIDYRLQTMANNQGDTDDLVCKKCKENEHVFKFAR
ncbi:MAG: hypothetical protein EOP53_05595 [Sphingobacteriales bacterium]|nr:MAG: hypothetical protein EOP53_05595 [Sphingobacteriales bacterium]